MSHHRIAGRRPRDRRGMALPLVLVACLIAFAAAVAAFMLRRNLNVQLSRVLVAHDLETAAVSALEEASYQLVMFHQPSKSRSEATSRIAQARNQFAGSLTPEGFKVPEAARPAGKLEHDATLFLQKSPTTLFYPPLTVANGLGPEGTTAIEPVEVRVIERDAGARVESPFKEGKPVAAAILAKHGLPPGVTAMQTTWGILELRCRAHQVEGPLVGLGRTAVRRNLYVIVDYVTKSEGQRRYGHVFPSPIGQYIVAD